MQKPIRPIRIEGNLAYVPLTKGYEAIIDASDVHLVDSHNWQSLVQSHTVYAVRTDRSNGERRDVRMHRVIMGEPDGFDVDHEDGNGLNNRGRNLRSATKTQNLCNQRTRSDNTSGYKGVSLHKLSGKWAAYIRLRGQRMHLGLFDAPEEAYAAYCKASAEYHKDFGRTA